MRLTLDEFNRLPEDQAQQALLACWASTRWAAGLVAGRPFSSVEDVLRCSDAGMAGLAVTDLAEALAGHPRIGQQVPAGGAGTGRAGTGRPGTGRTGTGRAGTDRAGTDRAGTGRTGTGRAGTDRAGWSQQEQAGVDPGDQATMQALAAGNQAYEQRFGHIYLVCATGRSGPELLALLSERLGNDPDAEWRVVRSELGQINRIRLRKLLDRGPSSARDAPGRGAR